MRAHIVLLSTVFALAALTGAAAADKKHHRYVGIHPIAKTHGGGMCHIQAAHVHVYAPVDVKLNYRVHDGYHHFVGDPVAYQWDGPKHSYYGHHPVQVDVVVEDDHPDTQYCYLDGAHYHAWEPPAGMKVKMHAGAYWYVGDFPDAYVKGKVTYDPIDVVYKPIVYTRPVVVVDAPPPGWYGGTVIVAPVVVDTHPGRGHGHGHAHAGVEVVVPTVQVEVGLPSVHIGVGGRVHGRHHGHHKGKHKKWKRRGGRGHR